MDKDDDLDVACLYYDIRYNFGRVLGEFGRNCLFVPYPLYGYAPVVSCHSYTTVTTIAGLGLSIQIMEL